MKIACLPGDGIGPEIMDEALRVLDALELPDISVERALVGGAAYHQHGHPLPDATLALCKASDGILFGAVGDPTCDALERHPACARVTVVATRGSAPCSGSRSRSPT